MEMDCRLVQMEWRPPGLSVCLLLVILPGTMKSRRSFLLASAHLGGAGEKAIKQLWCGGECFDTVGWMSERASGL